MEQRGARVPAEPSEQSAISALGLVDLVLLCVAAVLVGRLIGRDNGDIRLWYMPWYDHIVQFGRLRSLEGSFANYSPPYIYLLSAFTLLRRWLSPVVILKIVQLPGMILGAVAGWSICRASGTSTPRAILAGCLIALLPEALVNGLVWGQCDMLHTSVLLVCVRLFMSRRWNWAMAFFGVAVAVKLQAIFVGPALVAMVLAGELPILSTLWAPVAYAFMMLPAWLAGRPAKELLLIYKAQFATYSETAMNVANPYQILMHWMLHSTRRQNVVNALGMLLAFVVTLLMIYVLYRRKYLLRGRTLIAAMALPLLIEPYVLPKMHDRYYFAGNVFLALLATLDTRMAVPALLTQCAALAVYYRFLSNGAFDPHYYVIPTILVTVALFLFLRRYFICRTSDALAFSSPSA